MKRQNWYQQKLNLYCSDLQPKPKYLIWPVLARLVFIPLFLFCNYLPRDIERTLPVLITSDWGYWIIAILMSLSSGYLRWDLNRNVVFRFASVRATRNLAWNNPLMSFQLARYDVRAAYCWTQVRRHCRHVCRCYAHHRYLFWYSVLNGIPLYCAVVRRWYPEKIQQNIYVLVICFYQYLSFQTRIKKFLHLYYKP